MKTRMVYQNILLETRDRISVLTINRPDKRNFGISIASDTGDAVRGISGRRKNLRFNFSSVLNF